MEGRQKVEVHKSHHDREWLASNHVGDTLIIIFCRSQIKSAKEKDKKR